ncbi:hypothetical protein BN871_CS_00070 [Paenibacillus sp. P22]|nr:hypothetical protein BN871_CS_00070 [Paenibacillus sp. P22]
MALNRRPQKNPAPKGGRIHLGIREDKVVNMLVDAKVECIVHASLAQDDEAQIKAACQRADEQRQHDDLAGEPPRGEPAAPLRLCLGFGLGCCRSVQRRWFCLPVQGSLAVARPEIVGRTGRRPSSRHAGVGFILHHGHHPIPPEENPSVIYCAADSHRAAAWRNRNLAAHVVGHAQHRIGGGQRPGAQLISPLHVQKLGHLIHDVDVGLLDIPLADSDSAVGTGCGVGKHVSRRNSVRDDKQVVLHRSEQLGSSWRYKAQLPEILAGSIPMHAFHDAFAADLQRDAGRNDDRSRLARASPSAENRIPRFCRQYRITVASHRQLEGAAAGIGRFAVRLHLEERISFDRQIRSGAGFLERALGHVRSQLQETGAPALVVAHRSDAAVLAERLGLLLGVREQILERALLAFIACRIHVGDILGQQVKPLLQGVHRHRRIDYRSVHLPFLLTPCRLR